jgi:serine/threonine protein kinase
MTIPGYDILEELGRGGMGVVFKARQVHLDRVVAVKMMLPRAVVGAEELSRFRVEAQAAARLDHPNIVRVFDFGEHEGRPYFSMEFVPGGSLRTLLGAAWQPAAAAGLVHTLAEAIHHAHQRQVIHRDLKPANVLMHQGSTPKISDFGLAKKLDSDVDLTATGQLLGTVQYMAPEQATGDKGAIGPATDVHALGLILYQLLTGRPAFQGSTLLEILEHIRGREPAPPRTLAPGVPAALESICLRCLHKPPHRRFATARALAESLQAFLTDSASAPPPQPLPDPPHPDDPRRHWWRS